MTRTQLAITIAALAISSGCSVQMKFGARPMPLPPSSTAEACYHDNRMELSTGLSSVERWKYEGSTFAADWYKVYKEQVPGLIFYRNGQRLSPSVALELLRDAALETTYRRELDRLDAGRRRHRRRVVLGTGVAVGGIAVMAAAIPTDSVELLGIGGLATLVGIGIQLSGYKHGQFREQHKVYDNLFIEYALGERLLYAMRSFNQEAARQCGYRGEVDVPMPPELRRPAREGSGATAPM